MHIFLVRNLREHIQIVEVQTENVKLFRVTLKKIRRSTDKKGNGNLRSSTITSHNISLENERMSRVLQFKLYKEHFYTLNQ